MPFTPIGLGRTITRNGSRKHEKELNRYLKAPLRPYVFREWRPTSTHLDRHCAFPKVNAACSMRTRSLPLRVPSAIQVTHSMTSQLARLSMLCVLHFDDQANPVSTGGRSIRANGSLRRRPPDRVIATLLCRGRPKGSAERASETSVLLVEGAFVLVARFIAADGANPFALQAELRRRRALGMRQARRTRSPWKAGFAGPGRLRHLPPDEAR